MTERDIFLAALELTDSAARKAYLDKVCGDNAALRAAVNALFASHEGAGSFLNTPIAQTPGTTSSADTRVDDPADLSSSVAEQTVQLSREHAANMNDDDNDSSEEEIPLGYLSPSKKPDSLGRLGHYEVLQVLGKGAFGTVLKAFDEKLHRMVAIKVMSTELASTSPARKRFLREARSSAAIRHDNVVAIYAVEEQPIPYLVMEYIPGKTLADALVGEGPLGLTDSLRLSQQIASGLAAAHSQGLIHRDIKPANILLEEGIQWKVKITDFGLARAADDASMTQSGTIAGTPMFMSPEQAHSSNIDQRSDLFSFGSVMYQMVSGRPPFRASSTLAVLKRVTEDTPRPIQEIIPEVPDWLVTIISKLHEKKADDRYQTAQEVADLLARCQSEMQHAGKVTCVPESIPHSQTRESSETAPVRRGSPDPAQTADRRSPTRPGAHQNTGDLRSIDSAGSGDPRTTGPVEPNGPVATTPAPTSLEEMILAARIARFEKMSPEELRRSMLHRRIIVAAFVAVAAIIAVVFLNRDSDSASRDASAPGQSASNEVRGLTPPGSPEQPGWHGWPSDAPPPAIAPFNAEQAEQHQEAWAKYLNVPVEYTNSIGMKFRLIPPGEFMMGSTHDEIEEALKFVGDDPNWKVCIQSEIPRHKVILTRPVYCCVHEVTQSQYERVTGNNPAYFAKSGGGKQRVAEIETGDYPVESLTWNDAAQFCEMLSMSEKFKPCYFRSGAAVTLLDGDGYRLPTEAEWEFLSRAGASTRYCFGEHNDGILSIGWLALNAGDRTHRVGELTPNAFGLYDTNGNVWEVVQDWWEPSFHSHLTESPVVDPMGPLSSVGAERIMRGGSFIDNHLACRASARAYNHWSTVGASIGFRVALPIDAVRSSLKLTGPAIPKSQGMELSGTNPGSGISNSASQSSNPDPDHALAEWLLSQPEPRWLQVEGSEKQITRKEDLPSDQFRVVGMLCEDAGHFTDEDFTRIGMASVSSVQLGSKDRQFPNISDQGLKALATSHFAERGVQLIVSGELMNVTDEGLLALNSCVNLNNLQVSSTNFSDKALSALALPKLSTLFVNSSGTPTQQSQFTAAALQNMATRLPKLETFLLDNADLTMADLSPWQSLPLVNLQLLHCRLTDQQLRQLSQMTSLKAVGISFPGDEVTVAGFSELSKLSNLSYFAFSDCRLFNDDAMLRITNLSNLQTLSITGTSITASGLQGIDKLALLESLNISSNRISSDCLPEITKLAALRVLNLTKCPDITDAALPALESMKSLTELYLTDNPQLTEVAVRKLQEALPNCKIFSDD
ncbi:MAG: protein kinase [Planctomycetaceae bacterium]